MSLSTLGWVLVGGWVGGCGRWGWLTPKIFVSAPASSDIDDVLAEDGGLLHVLPLTVHLFFFMDK